MSKIRKELKKDINTLIGNPNISIPGMGSVANVSAPRLSNARNEQNLYNEAIKIGLKNKTVERKVKDGKEFYEIKQPISYINYKDKITGKFVLTEIDGKKRLFIVRPDVKAVAVPFGEFIDADKKSPFDYIIKNGKISDKTFMHSHYRSDNRSSSYMTKEEMKKLTEYYALKDNSQKVGENILIYLREGNQTLDEVANIWSGSGSNRYNFGTEIEAHADMLLNKTRLTKFIQEVRKYQKNGNNNKNFEKEYYNALGMADMARGDKGKADKILMDLIWGLPSDKTKKITREVIMESLKASGMGGTTAYYILKLFDNIKNDKSLEKGNQKTR